jgi:hypothetical protein
LKKFVFLAFLLTRLHSFGQVIHDESYLDPEFLIFKTALLNCIIQKDKEKLKTYFADEVMVSNDLCEKAACTKMEVFEYCFNEGADKTWEMMFDAIRFGFSRIQVKNLESGIPPFLTFYQAPSFLKSIDTENELLLLGEKINIRSKPSLTAEVVKRSSYGVFKCDCNVMDMTETTFQTIDGIFWIEIKLNDNQVGYVSADLTSYQINKEMEVRKINNQWKITRWYNGPGC